MLGEKIPGPTQRVSGRFVAGKKDRKDLVAQLLVAHTFAGFGITRREQHREKVAALNPGGPPLSQESRHQSFELGDRALIAFWLTPRKPFRKAEKVGYPGL